MYELKTSLLWQFASSECHCLESGFVFPVLNFGQISSCQQNYDQIFRENISIDPKELYSPVQASSALIYDLLTSGGKKGIMA